MRNGLVVLLLNLCGVAARSDVPAQYYKLFRQKAALSAVAFPPDPMPDHLTKRLNGLQFASLPVALQHALLWDTGLIATGDASRKAYVQVKVPCGNSMSDVFLPRDVLLDKAQCGLITCNAQILHFALSNCSLSNVETQTKCGISKDAQVSAVSSNPVWMEDGEVDTEAAFGVFLKQSSSSNSNSNTNSRSRPTTLFTIQERPKLTIIDDRQSCPSKATFIIPCRQLTTSEIQSGAWCDPTSGVLVDLWLSQELLEIQTKTDRESKSRSITIFTVLFIVATVFGVAFAFCLWKKRSQGKSTGGGSSSRGGGGGGSSQFVGLGHDNEYDSRRQRHVLVDHHQQQQQQLHLRRMMLPSESDSSLGYTNGKHPNDRASFTTAELEKINAQLCGQSTDLAEFCGDQELMMKRIPYGSLHFSTLIARGANGEVWRGEYAGQEVAIKRMLRDKQGDVLCMELFAREIRLASTLEHPNVVQFIGLSWRSLSELCMVSEFMASGDLAHYLLSKESRHLSWCDQKMSLALDIANALVYLHSLLPVIIHRDLKSLNVLLNENLEAKLSDFGLSRERSFEETMTSGVGTMLWTAPEVLRGDRYTEKADIYSYGVVLSELDTCLPPYSLNETVARAKQKNAQLLPLIRKGEITPQFRESVPKGIHELARACLDFVPEKRPNAMQIVYILRSKLRFRSNLSVDTDRPTITAIEDMEDAVERAKDVHKVLTGQVGNMSSNAVHTLLAYYFDRDDQRPRHRLVSALVARLVAARVGPDKILRFAQVMRTNPSMDGHVLEAWVIASVAHGGLEFERRGPRLGAGVFGASMNMMIPQQMVTSFDPLSDYKSVDGWRVPTLWNQGGYDAVCMETERDDKSHHFYFIQVTRSETHSFNAEPFWKLLHKIKAAQVKVDVVELLFLVPQARLKAFKAPVDALAFQKDAVDVVHPTSALAPRACHVHVCGVAYEMMATRPYTAMYQIPPYLGPPGEKPPSKRGRTFRAPPRSEPTTQRRRRSVANALSLLS